MRAFSFLLLSCPEHDVKLLKKYELCGGICNREGQGGNEQWKSKNNRSINL
jgi:hypothetical protein